MMRKTEIKTNGTDKKPNTQRRPGTSPAAKSGKLNRSSGGKTAGKAPVKPAAKPAAKSVGAENAAEGLVRLQKYLSAQGVCSRRAAETMIAEGRVAVNGSTVTEMGVCVDPAKDRVSVDGSPVAQKVRLRYLLLFKPGGYICSAKDERGRRTVLDLLDGVEERVWPVGRLDYDTSGLLLLTNDGELTNKLLHPSHQVEKTYLAKVQGVPDGAALSRLKRGIRLEDGMTAPAQAKLKRNYGDGTSLVEVTIHEGRNRQVRRMLEAVHCPVLHLKRVQLAFLDLGDLLPGSWRDLTPSEVRRLKAL